MVCENIYTGTRPCDATDPAFEPEGRLLPVTAETTNARSIAVRQSTLAPYLLQTLHRLSTLYRLRYILAQKGPDLSGRAIDTFPKWAKTSLTLLGMSPAQPYTPFTCATRRLLRRENRTGPSDSTLPVP
eukprot:gene14022-biopygen11120